MKFSSAALASVLLAADFASAYVVPSSAAFCSGSCSRHRVGASTFVPRRSVTAPTTARRRQQQQQPTLKRRARTAASKAATLTMFSETSGGMEELLELTEQSDAAGGPLAKQARKSPSLFKIAGYASIPLSAALGFGLVPSRRIAAHAAGALVTGIAGAVGKSRLDAMTESNALPALAQAVVDSGLGEDSLDEARAAVTTVQETFGLSDEDYTTLAVDIYARYLQGMVKFLPTAKTAELKELSQLKQVLQLDNLAVGEAHAAAAAEWYRQTCLFTPTEELDDAAHPDRQAMDKLLFLTERALQGGQETPEAFKFEMTRVAKAVGLDVVTAMERVADVAEPFYQRALQSTRAKLETQQVSSSMLERARQTLGVSDATAQDMHVAAFNDEVRACLGLPDKETSSSVSESEDGEADAEPDLSTLKFSEGSVERLEKLRDILNLSETDADYEVTLEATPAYQSTALSAMKDVLAKTKTPDDAWDIMEARRQDLLLKDDSSKTLISSMVMQALGGPLEETNKFAKVNNEAATYDNLLETLEAKQALVAILTKSGWDEFENFDETFCNPWDRQSACGFLNTEERIKLYRIFLTRSVRKAEDGKLTDEMFDRIQQVKGLLGITDQQAEIEARAAFGPQLQKALNTATEEITADYTEDLASNMKKDIDAVMENYRLSDDYLRESGAAFYARAVEMVSDKAPGGIPTSELSQALTALQELFKLSKEDTYPAHTEHFGAVYKRAVLEAMGTTGVIRPEFRESLDELRTRLGVAEENTRELFLEAVEEKMKPMVEWIGSEMERTQLTQQQLSQRRGKDMGQDVFQTGKAADGTLGLGAEVNIMRDIMELVDFYNENDIAREEQTGTETVEKKIAAKDGEEEKTVTEEIPIIETVYPVTALGCGAIDQELAELLYRQYIISSFTTQGPNASRYEENRDVFAGILGLETEKIDEINDNIGSSVYDRFVSNAMATKGAVDQQDMMFLANIQGKLNLSSEQSEKMLAQSQKKILSEEINVLLDDPTPEGIKAFREKCNAMGMDMQEDVGISLVRLTRMFESEITPGLKSGEINADSADILTDIQESFGIDAEECETMFENLLMRLSKNAMDLIQSELLRGREENAVDLIKELVRYAGFTGGDLGLAVEEATANQILNIYEALDFSGEDEEQVSADRELLETVVGMSS